MLGNISYHQYITTARLQINFTNRVKDMLKFAAQVSTVFPLFPVGWRSGGNGNLFFGLTCFGTGSLF
jgi:hypothetical protein